MAERFLRIFPTQMSEVEDIDSSKVLASDSNDQPVYVKGSSLAKKSEVESLDDAIDAEETARTEADSALETAISNEETARSEADSVLETAIGNEKTAREQADTTLGQSITAEATARSEADSALTTAINTEKTARENADTTLDGKISAEATTRGNADTALGNRLTAVENLIPTAASDANKLADKAYVDFGFEQMAAKYLSYSADGLPFPSKAAFDLGVFYYGGEVVQPSKNDYALVNGDETHDGAVTRYVFTTAWAFQYVVNNKPLNEAQLAALNSGANAEKIADIANKANSADVTASLALKADKSTTYTKAETIKVSETIVATQSNVVDFNNLDGNAIYPINASNSSYVLNIPATPSTQNDCFGFLIAMKVSGNQLLQVFYRMEGGNSKMYVRRRNSTLAWGSWSTEVTTSDIKQAYDATSEAPISGKGVAEVVGNIEILLAAL